jgi:hypothetical protein
MWRFVVCKVAASGFHLLSVHPKSLEKSQNVLQAEPHGPADLEASDLILHLANL